MRGWSLPRTGPGRRSTWTPRRLPGLLLWLASDYGLPQTGLAANIAAATSERLTIADNAGLSIGGDIDAWWVALVRPATLGADRYMIHKGTGISANTLEYSLDFTNSASRFRAQWGDATNTGLITVSANNLGAPSVGQNYLLLGYHDAANNLLGIRANNGTANTAATSGRVPTDTAGGFNISSRTGSANFWDGLIDFAAIGKPPGAIASVIDAISSRLYNGGNFISYSQLTTAEKTDWGLVSWWEMDESSDGSGAVSRSDSHGANTLTDTNTVTSAAGIGPSSRVSQVLDRSGNTNHALQTTLAARPLWVPNTFDTSPGLSIDGSNDFFSLTSAIALDGDFTIQWVAKGAAVAGAWLGHSSGTGKIVQTDSNTIAITNDANSALSLDHVAWDTGAHTFKLVRSGSTITLYQDGTAEAAGSLSGTITLDQIGKAGASFLAANLAELIIYNQAYSS
jgi:hypothetical protein